MANLRAQRRRCGRSENGASLVEFALILPVLTLLLLGTLTGGLTLSRQNSVKNAVREGARFGAVYGVDNTDYLDVVRRQVIAAASGDLDAGVASRYVCVAFVDEDDVWKMQDTDDASAVAAGDWDSGSTAGQACFDDGRWGLAEPRVQVVASRKSDIEALLYTQNVTLRSRAATRYERE